MRVVNNGGTSPLTNLQLAAKPAEAALFPYIRTFAADRTGWLWKAGAIDADLHDAGQTDRLRGGLATDHMTQFLTRDLYGRKLIPRDNNVVKRHAYLVKQVRNGADVLKFDRPCLQIGMSADGTTLPYGKGGMEPDSTTNEDCFRAGGWTAIFDILIPPDGETVKVTYSDDSTADWVVANASQPWAIMGSAAVRDGTGRAFAIYFDFATSPGRLFMQNRTGTAAWTNATHGTDYRTVGMARHVFMAGYDAGTDVMSLFLQSNSETTAIATQANVTVDIDDVPAGSKKARLYAIGTEGNGASIYCNGCFSGINGWLPDSTFHTDATKRALLWDWADEL